MIKTAMEIRNFIPGRNSSLLLVATYLVLVRFFRNYRRRALEKRFRHLLNDDGSVKQGAEMNPLDAQKFVLYLGWYEFPFSLTKSLEFALFKTYAIPTISKLLCQTGQMCSMKTAAKRGEDTAVLFQEFICNPLDSERSRLAIARLNFLHRPYGKKISWDDIMFTWAAVTVEQNEWFKRMEWRESTPLERHATYIYWREVGFRMGVPPEMVPKSVEELDAWYDAYEVTNMVPSKDSHELAEATITFMLSSIQIKSLRPLARKVIISMMSERLRVAMMLEEVSPIYAKVARSLFGIRAFIIRHFVMPRYYPLPQAVSKSANSLGKYYRISYNFEPYYVPRTWSNLLKGYFVTGLIPSKEKYLSDGYTIEDLGPDAFIGKGVKTVRDEAVDLPSADKGVRYGCPIKF